MLLFKLLPPILPSQLCWGTDKIISFHSLGFYRVFEFLILLQWSNQGIRFFRTAGSFPFCLNQTCNINTCKYPLLGNTGVAWPPEDTTIKKRVIFTPRERTAVLHQQWLIWPISSHIYFYFSFYHFLIFSFFPGCRRKSYPLLTKEIVGCSHNPWTNKTSSSL